MITDSFDSKSNAIIKPEAFYGEKKNFSDIAIATFSDKIFYYVLRQFKNTKIGKFRAHVTAKDIYLIEVEGRKIVFYLSNIGSTLATMDIIEINHVTGANKFIFFGSAGSLDNEKTKNKFVIPTSAYRDEGASYHFKKASDYIRIKNSSFMQKFFKEKNIPYIAGKVWTTDALYRETENNAKKRKDEGCIAVEMEVAGVQAVCDFYSFDFYDFLVTGDVLYTDSNIKYDKRGFSKANHDVDKFFIALELVKALDLNKKKQ